MARKDDDDMMMAAGQGLRDVRTERVGEDVHRGDGAMESVQVSGGL